MEKRKIISYLLNESDFVPAEDIAKEINASKKTVYRRIKNINDDYSKEPLITSERGRGYKINYEVYINNNKRFSEHSNLPPAQRKNSMINDLLHQSPRFTSRSELMNTYYVSESTINKDLEEIADELEDFDLQLKNKNGKVGIEGLENKVRKAIIHFGQNLHVDSISDLTFDGSQLNRYDADYTIKLINKIEQELESDIPSPYDINIFSHLYLLISRTRKSNINDQNNDPIDKSENPKLYRIAHEIIDDISRYLNVELPEVEVNYLYQYLVSSRITDSTSEITNFDEVTQEVTLFYIHELSEALNINLDSMSMLLDLASHIKPMINRLKHNIFVKNSLLQEIKSEYSEIFYRVSYTSDLVSEKFDLPLINEHENGFLTLYFIKEIEKNRKNIRAIVVCTTGIGTSELLKIRIEKRYPEIDVQAVTSTRDLEMTLEKYPDTELLLTTLNITMDLDIKQLVISPLLNNEDKFRISQKIKEIYDEKYNH